MVMAYATTRYVFDLQPGDIWWCTADPGAAYHFIVAEDSVEKIKVIPEILHKLPCKLHSCRA